MELLDDVELLDVLELLLDEDEELLDDLIRIGAYQRGSNPETDQAIAAHPALKSFLCQGVNDEPPADAFAALRSALESVGIG